MRLIFGSIIIGLILWLLRQVGVGLFGLIGDLLMITTIWQIRRWHWPGSGGALVVASLAVDVLNFSVWPIYTTTSLLTLLVYIYFIEPFS